MASEEHPGPFVEVLNLLEGSRDVKAQKARGRVLAGAGRFGGHQDITRDCLGGDIVRRVDRITLVLLNI